MGYSERYERDRWGDMMEIYEATLLWLVAEPQKSRYVLFSKPEMPLTGAAVSALAGQA